MACGLHSQTGNMAVRYKNVLILLIFSDAEIYEETAFTTYNLLPVANSSFCSCLMIELKD